MSISSQTPGDNNRPFNLAKRYDEAGNKIKAARFYRLAGEYAFTAYANEDAITHFTTALALTPDAQIGSRYALMFALERVYALSGQPEARSQNLVSLAALADALDDDRKRADVAARLALYKLDNGENDDVISIARLAVRIAQTANAAEAEATLHLVWGRALQRLGELGSAQTRFRQALTLAQTHALTTVEADSYRYLGVVSEENGSYAEAKSLYKQALALYDTLHDRRGNSNMFNNLGKVAYDQGEYTTALRYWDHAKPNYLAIGDQPGTCRLLINQSAICMDMGDYQQAGTYNIEALTLSREIGLRFGECLAQINLALVHHYQGKPETAVEYGQQALKLATEMGSKRLEGYAHNTLGKLLMAQSQFTEADAHYWEALAIWHELEQDSLRIEAEAGLAAIAMSNGETAEAQIHVDAILQGLKDGQSLDGTESPFGIYWTCYQILMAVKDSRAQGLLREGHQLLQERADKIADEAAKKLFLENVEIHKLIMTEVSNQS